MSKEAKPAPESSEGSDLGKTYDPAAFEDAIYEKWEQAGVFKADANSPRKPYTIVIPPPNITGVLHIGHALNNSLQDLLIRFKRMQGFEALWLPGTDHAGIATQNVVERMIAKTEGKNRYQIGREALIERIWKWRDLYGNTILRQLRKLGASCDWSRTRFTFDEGLSRAVREAFVRLHEAKLLYRGKYLVNWCPRCRTTLSDDEVDHKDINGKLYQIHYPFADGSGHLTVATTRPETMLGDTAVAVHPEDERYQALVGKKLRLPLVGREIPVVADRAIEKGFGTGCLKVTPAHDPVDYEIGRRHNLEAIAIFDEEARLNENVPETFRGMDRFAARKAVVAALEAEGRLGDVKPNPHQVGHCYRCHTMIEPYLTSQWFVNMKPLSELAVEATKSGRVRFFPSRWEKVYLHWFEEVRDWPVSRQIWWGHRVPAWYCLEDNPGAIQTLEAGPDEPFDVMKAGKPIRYLIGENAKPIVARDDPAKRPEYQGKTLIQDPDVLDTWFSSQLWPFSTLGWPAETPDLKRFFPTDTLVTGRDIIYFWVARMVMASELLMGKEPYRDVVINGTVCDGEGTVMSKSKGNGIDPLDIIRRYGADAVRFTIYDMATEGQDLRFPVQIVCPHCAEAQDLPSKRTEPVMNCRKCKTDFQQPVPNEPEQPAPKMGTLDSKRFEKGRNFANKVWNASRFVIAGIDAATAASITDAAAIEKALRDEDRWILSRLNRAVAGVTEALSAYQFNKASNALYAFFWDEFCAWTIELSKPRLAAGANADDKRAAAAVLLHVLDRSLRLLHPFCPFLSEALWAELGALAPKSEQRNLGRPAAAGEASARPETGALLAASRWPSADQKHVDSEIEAQFESLFEAVRAVRNIRQKNGIALRDKLKVSIRTSDDDTRRRLDAQRHVLEQMACLEPPQIGADAPKPKPAGAEVLKGAELYVSLAGLIDPEKERARLAKEIERAQNAVSQSEKKLSNDSFVKNAPPDKVEAERARMQEYRDKVASLQQAVKDLEG
ncbi:MAG: valine--tRNA ligase [Planctomycetes bacterium]|nr:valine--tRNA ligase [Planctomycetota bacterium]